MKTTLKSLFIMLTMAASMQLQAQKRITVEAYNDDISYYLDLKAVASVFGESRNLEDFERRLNHYDNGLSNLDLNNDGYIDYLRVIETAENNIHLVVIQAVLDRNVYQDVASIVVERDRRRNTYVQVIGDPYLYGYNYIIEPVYYHNPYIINWFWTSRYRTWVSPYSWGYYPRYYQYRQPIQVNIYMSNVYHHINTRHYYNYSNNIRNNHVVQMQSTVGRNDYGVRYPDRNFSNRNANANVRNKGEFNSSRSQSRNPQGSNSSVRQSTGNQNSYNESTRRGSTGNQNTVGGDYRSGSRTNENRPAEVKTRSGNNSYQSSGTRNSSTGTSVDNRHNQGNGSNVSKPTTGRTVEARPTERKQNESSTRTSPTVIKKESTQPSVRKSDSQVKSNNSNSRQSSVQTNTRSNSNSGNSGTQSRQNSNQGSSSNTRSGSGQSSRR